MYLILLLTLSLILLVQYVRRKYTHWQREGVEEEPAKFPFGVLDDMVKCKRGFGLIIGDIYEQHRSKIVGIYIIHKPTLLVRDAQLARQMMTSDFASFHDRGIYVDEKNDPLSASLFNLQGASWRNLRNKLTPSFSSGKIKGMFGTIDDVGDRLVQHLMGVVEKAPGDLVEIKEMTTTYAIDIIGSVIFGLDIDSFTNPNNEFRKVSNSLLVDVSILVKLHNAASFTFAPLAKLMNFLGFKNEVMIQLRDMMQRTIEFREKHNVVRKDLLQLLIRLRNTGKIGDDDDEVWDVEKVQDSFKALSIEKIAAQAFLFYAAGSETTAAASAFTIYELSMYPELLKEVREELDAVMARHNLKPGDKFTYEAVQELKFLDQCIMETVRKYPALPFLNRACTEDYHIEDLNYTVKKGTPILISLFGLHRDPNYFPNPMDYDPHRFDADNLNYDPTGFMPFGEGPRHCIALRMGKVSAKVAVAKVLSNFDLIPAPRKEINFRFDAAPVLLPEGGLHVRLTKRK